MTRSPAVESVAGTDRLSILMYHSIDASGSVVSLAPDRFERQMTALAERGQVDIGLAEAVSQRESIGQWPSRAVVLTFDDGYASVHRDAWPILSRHGFRATVFLVSAHIGGRNDWAPPPAGLGVQPLLDWSDAREMVESGIEMGAHTRRHPDLRRLSLDAQREEIDGSREEIEQRLGRKVQSFAYPYGLFGPGTVEIVAESFPVACTTRLARAADDPMTRLPRLDTYYFKDESRLGPLIDGSLDTWLTLRRAARALRRLPDRLGSRG